MQILKGGHETGFKRVKPEEYKPRLLHFHGTTLRNIQMTEIPMKKGNLNDEDTFIIDLGHTIYQVGIPFIIDLDHTGIIYLIIYQVTIDLNSIFCLIIS